MAHLGRAGISSDMKEAGGRRKDKSSFKFSFSYSYATETFLEHYPEDSFQRKRWIG